MNKVLLLLIILFITACGTVNPEQLSLIDPELQPYVMSFHFEAMKRGKDIDVTKISAKIKTVTNKYGERVVGVCFMGLSSIEIDVDYWKIASYNEKETLVFHELGHCALKREHKNGYDNLGVPFSIMNSTLLWPDVYENNREKLIDELFNGV